MIEVELFGVILGTSLMMPVVVVALTVALYPLFWLWMLIDAALREPADYPGRDGTEKLVWLLLMLVAHRGAIVYYMAVYARRRRTAAVSAAPALAV